jgi:hypothetical protein
LIESLITRDTHDVRFFLLCSQIFSENPLVLIVESHCDHHSSSSSFTMFARSLRYSASRASRSAARAFSSNGGGGGGGGAALPLAALAFAGAGYVYYDAQETQKVVDGQIKDLQVQLSGKTNSAFVFLKPHACKGTPGKVEAVLEGKSQNECELIESRSKGEDWRGICYSSSASWDKTTMPLFDPIDTTNYSFIIVHIARQIQSVRHSHYRQGRNDGRAN